MQTSNRHFVSQDDVGQSIIFTATRNDTTRIRTQLEKLNIKAVALAGDLAQNKRLDIMDSFSRGLFKVLVTTDVASRGLDLLSVTHVINFDLPKQAEEYVHRIGRTGRAGFKGTAISLVGPKDWNSFVAIKNYLNDDLNFETIAGLEGKFKGFRPPKIKKAAKVESKKKTTKPTKTTVRKKANKPKKAIPAPFDVDGHAPLRRKPKPTEDK